MQNYNRPRLQRFSATNIDKTFLQVTHVVLKSIFKSSEYEGQNVESSNLVQCQRQMDELFYQCERKQREENVEELVVRCLTYFAGGLWKQIFMPTQLCYEIFWSSTINDREILQCFPNRMVSNLLSTSQ